MEAHLNLSPCAALCSGCQATDLIRAEDAKQLASEFLLLGRLVGAPLLRGAERHFVTPAGAGVGQFEEVALAGSIATNDDVEPFGEIDGGALEKGKALEFELFDHGVRKG